MKVKNIYLCLENGQPIGHAVEIDDILVGTQLGVSHDGMHQVAKDIQDLLNISPMEHLMLMKKAIMLNKDAYKTLLSNYKPISFEEAKKIL